MTRFYAYYTFYHGEATRSPLLNISDIKNVYREEKSGHHYYKYFDHYSLIFPKNSIYPAHFLKNKVQISDKQTRTLYHPHDRIRLDIIKNRFATSIASIIKPNVKETKTIWFDIFHFKYPLNNE